MRVAEMVCSGHERDQLGLVAVFHTVPEDDVSVTGRDETFFVPITDKSEFKKDQRVLVHFSYAGITITDLEGEFLRKIRL